MNKCPRCENEKLKEDYNYCPICGALLYYEIAEGALEILNALLNNYKTCECKDSEEEKYRALVVGALEYAIAELEKTAQEVPVQEQYAININSFTVKEITCEVVQKLLNQLDNNLLSGHRI